MNKRSLKKPKSPSLHGWPKRDIHKVLISEKAIQKKVREMGRRITRDYKGKPLTMVGIMRGSFLFLADLIRATQLPVEVDLLEVSSYEKDKSTGRVNITTDLRESPQGKNILIVDDIVDTGVTIHHLRQVMSAYRPKSVKICSLLDKPMCRTVDVPLDYWGFRLPNQFVVGYGLDYEEKYRNFPYIAVLKKYRYNT